MVEVLDSIFTTLIFVSLILIIISSIIGFNYVLYSALTKIFPSQFSLLITLCLDYFIALRIWYLDDRI